MCTKHWLPWSLQEVVIEIWQYSSPWTGCCTICNTSCKVSEKVKGPQGSPWHSPNLENSLVRWLACWYIHNAYLASRGALFPTFSSIRCWDKLFNAYLEVQSKCDDILLMSHDLLLCHIQVPCSSFTSYANLYGARVGPILDLATMAHVETSLAHAFPMPVGVNPCDLVQWHESAGSEASPLNATFTFLPHIQNSIL